MSYMEEMRKAGELQEMQLRQFLKRMAEWTLGQPDCPEEYRNWAEGLLDKDATDEARAREANQ